MIAPFGKLNALVDNEGSQINVTVNPTVIPSAPVITSPISGVATTQASITVSGTAESNSTVKIYVNAFLVATYIVPGQSNSFSVSAALNLGDNTIIATATNIIGTSPDSSSVTVARNSPPTPPADDSSGSGSTTTPSGQSNPTTSTVTPENGPPEPPIVNNISDQIEVSNKSITLVGTAEPNSTVEIKLNGQIVATMTADDYGNFEVTVELAEGNNRISLTAKNRYGVSEEKVLNILYIPVTKAVDNSGKEEQPDNDNRNKLIAAVIFALLFLLLPLKRRKDREEEKNK